MQFNNQNLYPRTKHALCAMRSSTRTHTHPPNHPPTHTTVNITRPTPLKDNQRVKSTKAFHNVEKEQQHTFCLGDIRLGDIRLGDVRLRDGEGQDEWHGRISRRWKVMKTEGPSVSAFHLGGIRLCLSSLPSLSCNSTQVNIL